MTDNPFQFACPACAAPLEPISDDERVCREDGAHFYRIDGIWRFLLPPREQALSQFVREYETVRRAEGRGSDAAAYYRALPFVDLTNRFTSDWQIRSRSFERLIARVVAPLECGAPLSLIDLGAGNGWLSYQLARRGHHVAAVDLLTNSRDGLGAYVNYDAAITPVQAEFDCLPFVSGQFDGAIFNSSFHYSVRYESTLQAALRILKPNGAIVILDTPIYTSSASGEQMVAEREAQYRRAFGFPSNSLPSENYLTYDRLRGLSKDMEIEWSTIRTFRGWHWALRPLLARARGRRQPADFLVIVGKRRVV